MQGRHETCRACGLDWNISGKQRMPARGYLCPRCAKREQRDTGMGATCALLKNGVWKRKGEMKDVRD